MTNICIICNEEISRADYFMLALEIPYRNIPLHKGCYRENKANMLEILQKTRHLWYNINDNEKLSKKRKEKL